MKPAAHAARLACQAPSQAAPLALLWLPRDNTIHTKGGFFIASVLRSPQTEFEEVRTKHRGKLDAVSQKLQLEALADAQRFAEWPEEWAALCEGDDAEATRTVVVRVAEAASADFSKRTKYLFESPAHLACGLADAKGHGVRTARALIVMARQHNLIGILRGMRLHMHSGVKIGDVRSALVDDDYIASGGICNVFNEYYWPLVHKFAAMSDDKVLANVASLAPLSELLCGATRNVSISNDGGEHSCKLVTRGLTADQRRKDETATRSGAAIMRLEKGQPGLPPISEERFAMARTTAKVQKAEAAAAVDDGLGDALEFATADADDVSAQIAELELEEGGEEEGDGKDEKEEQAAEATAFEEGLGSGKQAEDEETDLSESEEEDDGLDTLSPEERQALPTARCWRSCGRRTASTSRCWWTTTRAPAPTACASTGCTRSMARTGCTSSRDWASTRSRRTRRSPTSSTCRRSRSCSLGIICSRRAGAGGGGWSATCCHRRRR